MAVILLASASPWEQAPFGPARSHNDPLHERNAEDLLLFVGSPECCCSSLSIHCSSSLGSPSYRLRNDWIGPLDAGLEHIVRFERCCAGLRSAMFAAPLGYF